MKTPRLPLVLITFSLLGMVSLGAWNFFQTRNAYIQSNRRWVDRVSSMVVAERVTWLHWIDRFSPTTSDILTTAGESNPHVSAVFLVDTEKHQTQEWTSPQLGAPLPLDPRLVVLELQVLQSGRTAIGPVFFVNGVLQSSVVRPLDTHHVLIAVVRNPEILTRCWMKRHGSGMSPVLCMTTTASI